MHKMASDSNNSLDAGEYLKQKIGTEFINSHCKKVTFEQGFKDVELIGVYFSAGWCPPCRPFTSKLTQLDEKWNNGETGRKIQMIYVAEEENEQDFQEYFQKMKNFLSFPWADDRIKQMAQIHEVRGIPALVILNKYGQVIDPSATRTIKKYKEEAIEQWLDD